MTETPKTFQRSWDAVETHPRSEPKRRLKGNRKYELTQEGVSKRFATKAQLGRRRWVLESMIVDNEETIAATQRRTAAQRKELAIVRDLEEGAKKQ